MSQSFTERLLAVQQETNSRVCVGLDPDPKKMPEGLKKADSGDLYWFGRAIVEATLPHACIYKPNQAFWAACGAENELARLIDFIHQSGRQVILDCKRNDIGNTARFYAREVFLRYAADAATVNAYLGTDTLDPWLEYGCDKAIFVLCHTSNPGAAHFQEQKLAFDHSVPLFAFLANSVVNHRDSCVAYKTDQDSGVTEVGLVMGATFPEQIEVLSGFIPEDIPQLLPGIGKQEGDLEKTVRYAQRYPFVVNASSSIIHASQGKDFAEVAGQKSKELQDEINQALQELENE